MERSVEKFYGMECEESEWYKIFKLKHLGMFLGFHSKYCFKWYANDDSEMDMSI